MLNGQKVVLIVDDEPHSLALLSKFLVSNGYIARSAPSVVDAISKLDDAVDLVVTDYQMPTMNGCDLLSMVRAKYPTVPVIGISGFRFEDRDIVSKLFDAFLFKPFRMGELLRSADGVVSQMVAAQA